MSNAKKRKILIVGLNFSPELVGIGKYTGDLAAYFVQMGFDLRVVTTPPYYPDWKIDRKYRSCEYRKEATAEMVTYRCPLWVPSRPTNLNRIPHLMSFALSSLPVMLSQIVWKPDLVICVIPTLFSAPLAWLTAQLCGSKSWLHIQDFELDAANNLGMLPFTRYLIRFASDLERWIFSRFDRISTISSGMANKLIQKGIVAERVVLFPNWVDTGLIHPLSNPKDTMRSELGIPEDRIIILYSGSMGKKQGLEDLVNAARELQGNANIIFIFCGNGSGREDLIKNTAHFPNIKHLSVQPLEKLNSLLNTADIHIMSQRASVADLVMPSKLLGMLASGKSIIAIADPNTEVGRVINKVGCLVTPQNVSGLKDAILSLAVSSDFRGRLGMNGRNYVCENWSASLVLPRFMEQINELLQGTT